MKEHEFLKILAAKSGKRAGVLAGIGDDGAVFKSPGPNQNWVIASDSMTEGVHFRLPWQTPEDLAYKLVATNVSDLAAMGAEPFAALWNLILPAEKKSLLTPLANGVFQSCEEFGLSLIGGDTCRGANDLTISLTVLGTVPSDLAVYRKGASAGEDLYCTGTLGDAGLGLELLEGRLQANGLSVESLTRRLLRPEPRLNVGLDLSRKRLATAMLDISDGLAQDLGHLIEQSDVAAEVDLPLLPQSKEAAPFALPIDRRIAFGEDYELLFTAPTIHRQAIEALATVACPITRIGRILPRTPGARIRWLAADGSPQIMKGQGFDHFA